jgi:transcriptional regulator with XRE-family HTH domain
MSMTNVEKLKSVFSERLKELIRGRPVTEFARRVGLQQSAIDNYIKKKRSPNAEAIITISSACCVSTDWLLGLTDSKDGVSGDEQLQKKLNVSEKKLARVNKALGHILKGTNELQAVVDEGVTGAG